MTDFSGASEADRRLLEAYSPRKPHDQFEAELFREYIWAALQGWPDLLPSLRGHGTDELWLIDVSPSGPEPTTAVGRPTAKGEIWLAEEPSTVAGTVKPIVVWRMEPCPWIPDAYPHAGLGITPPRFVWPEEALSGRDLREVRERLDLTQDQLALELGTSPNTIARWERGDMKIGQPRLVRLALERLEARLRPGSGAQVGSWLHLNEAEFRDRILDQLRSGDAIGHRLFLDEAFRAATSLRGDKLDTDRMVSIVDRVACFCATMLRFEQRQSFERGVQTLARIYYEAIPDRGQYPYSASVEVVKSWFEVVKRVVAIGALAMRMGDWNAARVLAIRPDENTDERYNAWIRHGLTMAARSNVVGPGTQLLDLAEELARQSGCLSPDAPSGEGLSASICQFDAVWNLVAIADAGGLSTSSYYPGFARCSQQATERVFAEVIRDRTVRELIFPSGDELLAAALRELRRMAAIESRNWTWGEFTSPVVLDFLAAHPTI